MGTTNTLREHRQAALLTGAELALLTGLTAAAISMIEVGARGGSAETKQRLAMAIGVPEHELFPQS
jgi:transcriptional regulator with XRE-family HTH domain